MSFAELTKELKVLAVEYCTETLGYRIQEVLATEDVPACVDIIAVDCRDGLPYAIECATTLEEGKKALQELKDEFGDL